MLLADKVLETPLRLQLNNDYAWITLRDTLNSITK